MIYHLRRALDRSNLSILTNPDPSHTIWNKFLYKGGNWQNFCSFFLLFLIPDWWWTSHTLECHRNSKLLNTQLQWLAIWNLVKEAWEKLPYSRKARIPLMKYNHNVMNLIFNASFNLPFERMLQEMLLQLDQKTYREARLLHPHVKWCLPKD